MKIDLVTQRNLIYGIIVLGILVLAGLNFLGWIFLQGLKKDLTAELKQQIVQTGKISTRLLNGSELEKFVPGMENDPVVLYYQQLLYDIKINNELENIVLLDPAGRLLVDYRLNFHIGDTLFNFPLQAELLRSAALGEIPEPLLLKSAGQYFLSAYLPVLNDLGEPASVLVIDAPLQFFSTLQQFEKGTLYVGIGGLGILLIFSVMTFSATRRLLRADARLKEQQRLAQLGQMAASVAHEIRNPLSIMKGAADVLRRKYQDSSDELLSFIPDEIERLNRLVEDFLQFARRRQLHIQKQPVREVIRETARLLHESRIRLQIPDNLPEARIDRDALRQILLNLIANAQQAIDSDGKIEINAEVLDGHPRQIGVEIKDNGRGIPRDELSRIFDPFYSSRSKGSGLGLTICKQLVEQMNGRIHIRSEAGKGTAVRVLLPAG